MAAKGAPRDLTGSSALCLEVLPRRMTCFVEIARPKSRGIVRAAFTDSCVPSTPWDDQRIFCKLGILSRTGQLEQLASFSFDMD